MWPFSRKDPVKNILAGVKAVKVNGAKYVIRKVNPLLDFDSASMPQIFTSYQSRRKKTEVPEATEASKAMRDMFAVVQAGLVKPELVPIGKGEFRGKEDGITVEDIFRDSSTGMQLYWEIIAHSLNRYKGLRGTIFLAQIKSTLYTSWLQSMDGFLAKSPSQEESLA